LNINDVTTPDAPQGDRLELIFARQTELMEKYHVIEDKNGLLQTPEVPVNLHSHKGQARLKDFAWRITEELAEGLDALTVEGISPHVQEEMSDCLHFIVEMALISGIGPKDFWQYLNPQGDLLNQKLDGLEILYMSSKAPTTITSNVTEFIARLGMVCHTLKNKPWKQTQILTDVDLYRIRFIESFLSFISVCRCMRINPEKLFNLYFRKSEVNRFRQRSNY